MNEHISYLIEVHDDYDASPNDSDCYDAEAKAAFERGEWSYVGVEVHAVREHFEGTVNVQTIASDSLWAVEPMCDACLVVPAVRWQAYELTRDTIETFSFVILCGECEVGA
jgi:hypothetical protein